jgi:broad specificity phosphatase PhoE
VARLAYARRGSPPAGDDASTLLRELPHDLEADPAGRAGDETSLAAKAEIHASTVSAVTTTIVLVRHGETDWNRENRFQGHADTPLNEDGRHQARELAKTLEPEGFTAAYSSPLARAFETAMIVAEPHELQVRPYSALMEVDLGSWSGLTRADVEATFPAGYARWLEYGHGWQDGESYDELGERVVAGLLDVAARHPNELVLAVTHGGPMRSALAAAGGVPFEEARRTSRVLENCAVVRVAVRDGSIEEVD